MTSSADGAVVQTEGPKPLPRRWGCPLALAISIGLVILYETVWAWVVGHGRRLDEWGFYAFLVVQMGLPFMVLAVAGTRDLLAWTMAFVLTAALWGYGLFDLTRTTGVNFLLGFVLLLSPLVIAASSLVIAGIRGRIPEWGLEDESATALCRGGRK